MRRTNNPYTRERYTRLISLVTNSRQNSTEMLSVTNVTNGNSKRHMFELSQIIYHLQSNSFPLMLSIEIPAFEFEKVIEVSIIPIESMRIDFDGNWYLCMSFSKLVDFSFKRLRHHFKFIRNSLIIRNDAHEEKSKD